MVCPDTMTARQARRLLMHSQRLFTDPDRRAGPAAVDRLIDALGYVQIDSIIVLERAHHLTLRTRLTHYKPSHLRVLLEDKRTLFEHWTHDASAIPMRWHDHWKHRFKSYRRSVRENNWWQGRLGKRPQTLCRAVLKRIESDGPMRSRDFEFDRSASQGWWGWKPSKAALEYLWRCGELAIVGREPTSFQKVYDLASRVHPQHHNSSASNPAHHIDWACGEALNRLGTATPSELAGFFRAVDLAAARAWCARGLASGELIEVVVARQDAATRTVTCVAPSDLARRLRQSQRAVSQVNPTRLRLICPFDPVIRDRKRLARLFGFHYRFEAFVPQAQRRYGYYVLPILEGDTLTGRVDLKTDRQGDQLLVRGLWWEPGIKPTAARRRSLKLELEAMARFVGVANVSGLCKKASG